MFNGHVVIITENGDQAILLPELFTRVEKIGGSKIKGHGFHGEL